MVTPTTAAPPQPPVATPRRWVRVARATGLIILAVVVLALLLGAQMLIESYGPVR